MRQLRLQAGRSCFCSVCGTIVPKWFARDCALPAILTGGTWPTKDIRHSVCLGEYDEYPKKGEIEKEEWKAAHATSPTE